ncbi:MAG: Bax inhibitor-1/YccA family protein [Betaproteobacteria bacterium]|nr:Bax inhibitor-1/YccA family protein [Betaproteobacteria bacterium]
MQPELENVRPNFPTGAIPAPELALERSRVLRNTYMLLALSMVPTVIGAVVGVNTDFTFLRQFPIMGPLVMLAVMIGLLFGVTRFRNSSVGVLLLLGFTFVAGWWLGPMLQVALGLRNGAQLIGLAAGGTGLVLMVMSGIATRSKRDFSFLGKFLFVGLILLIIASIANLFFQVPALALTISTIAVFVFSLFILHDVSRVVNGGETNYVMAAMAIYLDIYNLFISLLHLLMAFTGERD